MNTDLCESSAIHVHTMMMHKCAVGIVAFEARLSPNVLVSPSNVSPEGKCCK